MVLTRTRFEEDRSVVVEGSSSALRPGTNRRRNRNSSDAIATGQPAAAEQTEAAEQTVIEQPVVPRKRRGPSKNDSVTKTLRNLPDGSKIPLTLDKDTKTFVGDSATLFATECGIIIRNACPMKYHKWDLIPEDEKAIMYEKLEGKFELLRKDNVFMEYVNSRLHAQWKRTRGVLSLHWKKNGGKTNPELARTKMMSGCRSEEDRNHLCDYWELEKTRKYSDKMEANRAKQINVSRGGSRSIANHAFKLTNPETQMPPSPFELYHKLHFNAEKQEWSNDHSRIEYENIVQHKKAAMDKLNSEGTTITTAMEHKLEKEAIKSVCGKRKTIQSGWEVGVGPVFRKKDTWMKSATNSPQHDSSKTKAHRDSKVTALEEELKKSNVKQQRMLDFIVSQFPEFGSTLLAPAGNEAEELAGDSEN